MDVKFVTVLVVLAVMVSQTSERQLLCSCMGWMSVASSAPGQRLTEQWVIKFGRKWQLWSGLFPGAFNCCMKISDEIPKVILRRVERFEIQKADGPCHLEAIILHTKGKKFCVNPCSRKVKKMMKKMKHKIQRRKSHVRKKRRTRITRETRSSCKIKQDP